MTRMYVARVQVRCLNCGEVFSTPPSRVRQGRARYCSRECMYGRGGNGPVAARFWSHVDRTGGEGSCWLWLSGCGPKGYGQFMLRDGVLRRAHRMAWELTNGPIPDGLLVCHDCPDGDNPRCCNPAHLFLGTAKDNTDDMIGKGRDRFFGRAPYTVSPTLYAAVRAPFRDDDWPRELPTLITEGSGGR